MEQHLYTIYAIGFSEVAPNSLCLSGKTDIYSSIAAFVPRADGKEQYLSPDNQINNTILYNEMDFYRFQNGKRKQPDYILVFKKDGQIEQIDYAKKASKEFEHLPIVIVDIDKCLEIQKNQIDNLFERYNSGETNLAKEIYHKIANNRKADKRFCLDIKLQTLRQIENSRQNLETQSIVKKDVSANYNMTTIQERDEEQSRMKNILSKIHSATKNEKDRD